MRSEPVQATSPLSVILADEDDQITFGRHLGEICKGQGVIFLQGDLGMGKTTLTRGVLSAYGYQGAVKSPTYTLVETYTLGDLSIFHFDLYRLSDPEELEYMGIRDYFTDEALCLIEWPDKGSGFLPVPDLQITLSKEGSGRRALLIAQTHYGSALLVQLHRLQL